MEGGINGLSTFYVINYWLKLQGSPGGISLRILIQITLRESDMYA